MNYLNWHSALEAQTFMIISITIAATHKRAIINISITTGFFIKAPPFRINTGVRTASCGRSSKITYYNNLCQAKQGVV
jgi:hypothetical protein